MWFVHATAYRISNQPPFTKEADYIGTTKLIRTDRAVEWFYDEEADVLYLSFGEPRAAVGQDIGEGVIVRYDEVTGQVVGLTLIGLRARLEGRHEE